MRKPTNQIAGLFLMATSILLGCLLHPGESYASVRSLNLWQTKLQTAALSVTSDYLVEGGQSVLLQDLTEARTIEVRLQSNQSPISGTVEYTVTPENAVTVETAETVEVSAEGTVLGLTLTPAQLAEDTAVTITVSWTAESGKVLKADFCTLVPKTEEVTGEPEESEPTVPEETEPVPEQQAEKEAPTLTVMEEFVPGSAVVIKIKHPENCEKILLGLAEGAAFPAGTVYSIDYGTSGIVLYDPAQLQIQPKSGVETHLLLRMPETFFAENSAPLLLWANVIQDTETVLTAQVQPLAATLQISAEDSGFVLTPGDIKQLPLPFTWNGCTLTYTVQRLTETENGIEYKTAESTGLSVFGQSGKIAVSLTGSELQAGTYRMVLVWRHEIYQVAQKEIVFYVNYSGCSSTETTGGNEQ